MIYDVWLIIVGAIIGFVSSVGIIVVERLFNYAGSIKLYYKFINEKTTGNGWGVREKDDLFVLEIPVTFELQNTTNSTRVIRDLSLELFKGDCFVCKLVQIEYSINRKPHSNDYSEKLFGDNGSYSFVVEPRCIKKEKCLYSYHISKKECSNIQFDTIRISYYKENDKKVSYIAKKDLAGWMPFNGEIDHEWILLKS